ncbi:MAG TPA: DUF4384 domain-containing protein, partial [Hyphomicrobium sp.]|nr:DUF4384 domain-containing protein [Hyphomicrobium sp.]
MAGSRKKAGRLRPDALGVLALLAAAATAGPLRAEPVALAERARAVLEAHCPDCRDVGMPGASLDLSAIAVNPRLVVPKRPDASRIYQRLLASGSQPAPAPAEIEAVRDWIEGLPARDEGCRDRTPITRADVEAQIDQWIKNLGVTEAADTRFVSLAHLWNACVSAARLKDYRDAVEAMLAALARSKSPLQIETIGDASAILVVRWSEIQRPEPEPEVLTAPAPDLLSAEATPADWLAARFLHDIRPQPDTGERRLKLDLDGAALYAVTALAQSWTQNVDLVRASAERGVTARALTESLSAITGDNLYDAQRLIHSTLTRAEWNRLARVLDGYSAPERPKRTTNPSEIDVLLWTDQPFYRPRDLVTVNVSVDKACHLTLINIDQQGKAIVLFPNELEQDNLVAPGVTIRVPGRDADYQFRFDHSGEEQIVAICQRTSSRPAGIDYDYEKQRFQTL